MTQQKLTKNLASIGEEISHELGIQFVKDFQTAYPADITSYQVGRNILESILSQPGCVGIRFYNAINEMGEKTLVYVGVNNNDEVIAEFISVNAGGAIEKAKGIVADRLKPPTGIDDLETDLNTTWGVPE